MFLTDISCCTLPHAHAPLTKLPVHRTRGLLDENELVDGAARGPGFTVTVPSRNVNGTLVPQTVYDVYPNLARFGKWDQCCTCRQCSILKHICPHLVCVVITLRDSSLMQYDKPWFTPENWQLAVGVGSGSPISAAEILTQTKCLQTSGELQPLKELPLAIKGCGRPSLKLDAESEKRFRSFVESIDHVEKMQEAAVREVISGKARKNPGGQGTPKTCG